MGTLTEPTTGNFTVEFFASSSSGAAEGQSFLKALTVSVTGSSAAPFSETLTLPSGQPSVTATVTDPLGDTSPFSNVLAPIALTTTTTTLSPPSASISTTQSAAFTAVVAPTSGTGTPTGSVLFTLDSNQPVPVALQVTGGLDEAIFNVSGLAPGQHTLSASYPGVSPFSGSTAKNATIEVAEPAPADTRTALSSSADPSKTGQSVTFTAIVAPESGTATPTGSVTFSVDGQAETPSTLSVANGGDEATFTTSSLSAGSHTITAVYSGDSIFDISRSSPLSQTVSAPVQTLALLATTTTLRLPTNPPTVGSPVTFTAIVAPASGGGTPSGTVTFSIDGVAQPPVTLAVVNGLDEATFTTSSLSAGSHSIEATYKGDNTFASTSSSVQDETLSAAPPRVVTVQRFGFHAQPTSLVLTFGAPLDPATAQNVADFKIVTLGGRGREGSRLGHVTLVRDAVYDPATWSVTLHPAARLDIHNFYRLTVDGAGARGLTGRTGLHLDGNAGSDPGSNYVVVITGKLLAGPAPGWQRVGNVYRPIHTSIE